MKEKITKLLKKAGINVKAVTVLGRYIHIDSYNKYDDNLKYFLASAGFKVLKAANCQHLDGYKGYRISAKV